MLLTISRVCLKKGMPKHLNMYMYVHTPTERDMQEAFLLHDGLGHSRGTGTFQSSPGDPDVYPRLKITVWGFVFLGGLPNIAASLKSALI